MSFSDEEEFKRQLKKFLFYNAIIETPKIKKLNNVDMLRKLPFKQYIVKTVEAFKK